MLHFAKPNDLDNNSNNLGKRHEQYDIKRSHFLIKNS